MTTDISADTTQLKKEEPGVLKSNQRPSSHFRAARRYTIHSHTEEQYFKIVPEISRASSFCNCLQKLEGSQKKKLGFGGTKKTEKPHLSKLPLLQLLLHWLPL